MLTRTLLKLLMSACIWAAIGRLKADQQDCRVEIESIGKQHVNKDRLNMFNLTLQKCQSSSVYLTYLRRTDNGKGGESMADLNQIVLPLLTQISNLRELDLIVLGGEGISVEFKIPSFSSAPDITFIHNILNLRLLYNNGTEVRDSLAESLEASPFNNRHPITILLTKGIKYHLNTCPLIFNRAFISILNLDEISDSAVKHNLLSFESTNRTLSSIVYKLQLTGYGLRFDLKTFPLSVFSKTKIVFFRGMMNLFQGDTLKKSTVYKLILAISRLRRFFHNNPDWLNEANKRHTNRSLLIEIDEPESRLLSIHKDQTGFISWIESIGVDPFEDSSFCIFYQIELHSLNVLFYGEIIKKRANESCSCLLFWIVSNYQVLYHGRSVSCVNQVQLIKQCNFDKMAKRCPIEKVEPLEYRTIYDTVLDFEFFKYLADVWLVPVTSLFGIFANFLVIRTFRKIKRSTEYRRNKLTDKGRFMWEYTYYNSWFLLLHGFIFLLGPLTTCIELDGIFCSPFISTNFFRLYYLLAEKLMGNTFRLAANMSSTMFVLYRFGLNTEKLVRLRKVKPKKSIACLFIASLLISVITLFVNEKLTVKDLWEYAISYLVYAVFDILKSGLFLQSAFLLNTFLVTTLFTLLNMGIDLRLLSLLRSQNTERRKEEAEKRITKMVILNGLFSFLFRLPEMISSLLLLIYTLDRQSFPICLVSESHFHSVCPMLFSISHFLLTVSYLENLILLYYFNDSFRKNFKWPMRIASLTKRGRTAD
nr:G protein-coupled receptor [Proales similis]